MLDPRRLYIASGYCCVVQWLSFRQLPDIARENPGRVRSLAASSVNPLTFCFYIQLYF